MGEISLPHDIPSSPSVRVDLDVTEHAQERLSKMTLLADIKTISNVLTSAFRPGWGWMVIAIVAGEIKNQKVLFCRHAAEEGYFGLLIKPQ